MKFKTTAAYISGGLCGDIWMPQVKAGYPIHFDLRGPFGFYPKGWTFAEALQFLILDKGGDFRCPAFTADTVIHIERTTDRASGKYSVHVKEIEVSKLAPDWTDQDTFTADVMGEE